ncbi:MAG: polyprenyl synthetase family protein [Alphaproteobacteria bacterium]
MNILSKIKRLLHADIESMNSHIKELTQGRDELIREVSKHLINSGGKRLRPILTLICAKFCEYKGTRHILLAASVEFIHTATLLHDDVVDESMLRRGVETANNKWGNKASILVGDFLLSQAFKIMVKDGSLKVLDILSSASAIIAEGEVMQLSSINNLTLNLDQYIEIVKSKTAELFAAACQIGAVVANSEDKEGPLRDFGMNLGIAFQIIDDGLDYFSNDKDIGKSVGDDFREGKITLPVIVAYDKSDKEEKEFWRNKMNNSERTAEDLIVAINIMNKYSVSKIINEYASRYINLAKQSLDIFPQSEIKTLLLEILAFSLKRLY